MNFQTALVSTQCLTMVAGWLQQDLSGPLGLKVGVTTCGVCDKSSRASSRSKRKVGGRVGIWRVGGEVGRWSKVGHVGYRCLRLMLAGWKGVLKLVRQGVALLAQLLRKVKEWAAGITKDTLANISINELSYTRGLTGCCWQRTARFKLPVPSVQETVSSAATVFTTWQVMFGVKVGGSQICSSMFFVDVFSLTTPEQQQHILYMFT